MYILIEGACSLFYILCYYNETHKKTTYGIHLELKVYLK